MTKLHFTIQFEYLHEHKLVAKRIYLSSLLQIIAQFHHSFMLKCFGNNVSCLFTYENVFISNKYLT